MKPLALLYGAMPTEMSPDATLFCLFSESAAREAAQAHEATTWGQFAKAIGLPFDQFVDTAGAWGAEIAEAFGLRPEPGDSFRLADYWGNWHFAGIVIPPCQAAVLAVLDRPAILRLLSDVGFEFAFGAPGSDGDAIIFRDLTLIPRLEAEITRRGLQHQLEIKEAAVLLASAMGLD